MFSRSVKALALCAGVATGSVAATTSVMSQAYPTQPIKILVGFGPGSAADILARQVGREMEARLGQPIVVENRPGNSSMIAAETVARATPDGYTLFMATIANTLNPAETKSSFNLAKDLAPIALLGIVPNVRVDNEHVVVADPRDPAGAFAGTLRSMTCGLASAVPRLCKSTVEPKDGCAIFMSASPEPAMRRAKHRGLHGDNAAGDRR